MHSLFIAQNPKCVICFDRKIINRPDLATGAKIKSRSKKAMMNLSSDSLVFFYKKLIIPR
jgi:hypothetical protein